MRYPTHKRSKTKYRRTVTNIQIWRVRGQRWTPGRPRVSQSYARGRSGISGSPFFAIGTPVATPREASEMSPSGSFSLGRFKAPSSPRLLVYPWLRDGTYGSFTTSGPSTIGYHWTSDTPEITRPAAFRRSQATSPIQSTKRRPPNAQFVSQRTEEVYFSPLDYNAVW